MRTHTHRYKYEAKNSWSCALRAFYFVLLLLYIYAIGSFFILCTFFALLFAGRVYGRKCSRCAVGVQETNPEVVQKIFVLFLIFRIFFTFLYIFSFLTFLNECISSYFTSIKSVCAIF